MKKGTISTLILIVIFFVGLSLLLYPTVSNYWNSLHSSKAIAQYHEDVANLDNEIYKGLLDDAKEYNKTLLSNTDRYNMTDEQRAYYEKLLNVSGNGILGYIEIPSIRVSLPIYHGTDNNVLQIAVGHFEGSSLPVGGEGCHAVLTGHRGLPSARLFTDLDRIKVGDTFIIRVLNEMMTYEVDSIRVVEPHEMYGLEIDPQQDLCTLVTCTPYGVNSHRMLVRGHRVENAEEEKIIRVTADAMRIEPVIVAPIVAIPILLALLMVLIIKVIRKN